MSATATWKCSECGDPIHDGAGYVRCLVWDADTVRDERAAWNEQHPQAADLANLFAYPEGAPWVAVHGSCDPLAEREDVYSIGVERLRAPEQLLGWTTHLNGKAWVRDTDWDALMATFAAEWGAEVW